MSSNKSARFNVRLTEPEFEKLKSDSKDFGYERLSDFGRYKLLLDINTSENVLASKSLKDELKVFNYQMNRLGNNINQITKAVHTNEIGHQYAIEEVKKHMKKLVELAEKLNVKIQ